MTILRSILEIIDRTRRENSKCCYGETPIKISFLKGENTMSKEINKVEEIEEVTEEEVVETETKKSF